MSGDVDQLIAELGEKSRRWKRLARKWKKRALEERDTRAGFQLAASRQRRRADEATAALEEMRDSRDRHRARGERMRVSRDEYSTRLRAAQTELERWRDYSRRADVSLTAVDYPASVTVRFPDGSERTWRKSVPTSEEREANLARNDRYGRLHRFRSLEAALAGEGYYYFADEDDYPAEEGK